MRLVDDLLDVSRVARGKVTLTKMPLELASVVAKAVEATASLLEQRRHQLLLSVPARGLPVEADEVRLTQVVSNLLTNAARYTPPGGRIEVTAAREGDDVVLRVKRQRHRHRSDPAAEHVRDVRAGPRAARTASQGGLGLGLSLARTLTDAARRHRQRDTATAPAAAARSRCGCRRRRRWSPAVSAPRAARPEIARPRQARSGRRRQPRRRRHDLACSCRTRGHDVRRSRTIRRRRCRRRMPFARRSRSSTSACR